jgi:hypothetical protein
MRDPERLIPKDEMKSFYENREVIHEEMIKFFMVLGFLQAIVPMLFGAIGACTYVLRTISQQILDVTFASTSPIRHSVRVFVGALAGFAVGLGVVTDSGLSTAALAFVAGYAVEPVFATMDSIADKFRKA